MSEQISVEESRIKQLEQQLQAADVRIKELEAALVLSHLPSDSRKNVIDLVQEAA
ncbi:hypothetical protein HQ393_05075 [Chitinibacter bivalviorum]|uniref:Uncharacterized protein n=1 Tax=Chitinibacter bivalviorum TaxID=2739434 RepID=A0A7H9BGF0_9NEIS|nr:hypothetical protein [Chitinibacter bivalviorum]QLG87677.1 hypothetical protein HQ393_05075 [Chitinibacter bivalviorum]